MTERRRSVEAAILEGDVAVLLEFAEGRWCGCMGPEGDEPLCRCQMTSRQVLDAVSYAALKRGKLVRLRK